MLTEVQMVAESHVSACLWNCWNHLYFLRGNYERSEGLTGAIAVSLLTPANAVSQGDWSVVWLRLKPGV